MGDRCRRSGTDRRRAEPGRRGGGRRVGGVAHPRSRRAVAAGPAVGHGAAPGPRREPGVARVAGRPSVRRRLRSPRQHHQGQGVVVLAGQLASRPAAHDRRAGPVRHRRRHPCQLGLRTERAPDDHRRRRCRHRAPASGRRPAAAAGRAPAAGGPHPRRPRHCRSLAPHRRHRGGLLARRARLAGQHRRRPRRLGRSGERAAARCRRPGPERPDGPRDLLPGRRPAAPRRCGRRPAAAGERPDRDRERPGPRLARRRLPTAEIPGRWPAYAAPSASCTGARPTERASPGSS